MHRNGMAFPRATFTRLLGCQRLRNGKRSPASASPSSSSRWQLDMFCSKWQMLGWLKMHKLHLIVYICLLRCFFCKERPTRRCIDNSTYCHTHLHHISHQTGTNIKPEQTPNISFEDSEKYFRQKLFSVSNNTSDSTYSPV